MALTQRSVIVWGKQKRRNIWLLKQSSLVICCPLGAEGVSCSSEASWKVCRTRGFCPPVSCMCTCVSVCMIVFMFNLGAVPSAKQKKIANIFEKRIVCYPLDVLKMLRKASNDCLRFFFCNSALSYRQKKKEKDPWCLSSTDCIRPHAVFHFKPELLVQYLGLNALGGGVDAVLLYSTLK